MKSGNNAARQKNKYYKKEGIIVTQKNSKNTFVRLLSILLIVGMLMSFSALSVNATEGNVLLSAPAEASTISEVELKIKGSGSGEVLINGEATDKFTPEGGFFTLTVTPDEGSFIGGIVFAGESVIFEDETGFDGTVNVPAVSEEEVELKVVFTGEGFRFFDSFLDFDLSVFKWVQSIQSKVLNAVMVTITTLGDEGIIFILMALILLCTKKYRKAGFAMIIALLVMTLCNNVILKDILARSRPFNLFLENPGKYPLWGGEGAEYIFPELVHKPSSYSFPSGHTSSAFAAAIAVLWYDRKIGIPTTIFACLMGFSRIYVEVHYCTDVIAGMVVGIIYALIGVLIVKLTFTYFNKVFEAVWNKVFKKKA